MCQKRQAFNIEISRGDRMDEQGCKFIRSLGILTCLRGLDCRMQRRVSQLCLSSASTCTPPSRLSSAAWSSVSLQAEKPKGSHKSSDDNMLSRRPRQRAGGSSMREIIKKFSFSPNSSELLRAASARKLSGNFWRMIRRCRAKGSLSNILLYRESLLPSRWACAISRWRRCSRDIFPRRSAGRSKKAAALIIKRAAATEN